MFRLYSHTALEIKIRNLLTYKRLPTCARRQLTTVDSELVQKLHRTHYITVGRENVDIISRLDNQYDANLDLDHNNNKNKN